jgi:hypothetical protein
MERPAALQHHQIAIVELARTRIRPSSGLGRESSLDRNTTPSTLPKRSM